MTEYESLPVHLRRAAEWQQDVTLEQIADVYAQAILGAADGVGQTQRVLEEFDSLVEDLFERFPEWEAILVSPWLSQEEKIGVLERVFRGRASEVFFQALKVLVRHGRFDAVRAVRQRLHVHWRRRQHQRDVEVRSAVPLSKEELEHIRQIVCDRWGEEPILHTEIDPQLIGGVVIRVGDVVYDGSLANQLERLRQRIIHASSQRFR